MDFDDDSLFTTTSIAASSKVGNEAESRVLNKLDAYNQSVNFTPRHDTGQDLLIKLRHDGKEYPLELHGQVKGGQSRFKSYVENPPAGFGWWYREETWDHFNTWAYGQTGCILFLVKPDTPTIHWVYIEPDALVEAGQGAKIFVPESQTLDHPDSADQLFEIAKTRYLSSHYEGTILRTADDKKVESGALYRTALVAPRLLAPHPNQVGDVPTDAASAIASLFIGVGRVRERSDYPEHSEVKGGLKKHPEWQWRFFSSIYAWIVDGNLDEFPAVIRTTKIKAEKVAAIIAYASALFAGGAADEALKIIRSAPKRDLNSEDAVWVKAHEASLLFQLGNDDVETKVIAGALRKYRKRRLAPVYSTIRFSLVDLRTALADFDDKNFINYIQANDNMVAWWRAFAVEPVIFQESDVAFEAIGLGTGFSNQAYSPSHNQLLAASQTALLAGNYRRWAVYVAALVKIDFSRIRSNQDDQDSLASVLGDLMVSATDRHVRAAVKSVWFTGPSAPLVQAVNEMAHRDPIRTTLSNFLAVAAEAGDLLPDMNRQAALDRLIGGLTDSSGLEARYRQSLSTRDDAIKAIKRLAKGLPDASLSMLLTSVLKLAESTHEHTAETLVTLLDEVPDAVYRAHSVEVRSWLTAHKDGAFSAALARKVFTRWKVALTNVLKQVDSGNFLAVNVLDSSEIPPPAASKFLAYWEERLSARIAEVIDPATRIGFGGAEPSEIVALTYYRRPGLAKWWNLFELIKDPKLPGFMKRRPIQIAVMAYPNLNADEQASLRDLLATGVQSTNLDYSDFFANSETLGGAVEVAVTTLCDPSPEVVRGFLQRLTLSSSVVERQDAIAIIYESELPDADLALEVLIKDPIDSVRGAARVARLSKRIVKDSADDFAKVVEALTDDGEGVWVSLQIGYRIQRSLIKAEPSRLDEVRAVLAESKSVLVRATVGAS